MSEQGAMESGDPLLALALGKNKGAERGVAGRRKDGVRPSL